MHLRVRYHRASDVDADYTAQISRGGLLVRAEPSEELQQFQDVKLELIAGAAAIVHEAQVLQVFPGAGVAVKFEPNAALEA